MKYSIWILPPNPIYSHLSEIIKNLSTEFNGPVFEPHLTVVGNIDMELAKLKKRVSEIAAKTEKLNLSLGPISFSTTYFQNVLVRVNSTADLMSLNFNLKNALKLQNDVFMPHFSLLYGEHNMYLREKAAMTVKPITAQFTSDSLVITPSTPNPKDWIHSATIPFKS